MNCCEECAYPGNPGTCVRRGACPCHHDGDPLPAKLTALAARYDTGNGEAAALADEALARLAYRRRLSGKTCHRCKEFKPMSAFGFSARETDGLNGTCKTCRRVNAYLL